MLIQFKNINQSPLFHQPILNGREAEAAVAAGISSEEDESVDTPKFIRQTHSVKQLLKSINFITVTVVSIISLNVYFAT